VVVERGPHHRVIQRLVAEPQPDGSVSERLSSYTELATGLHYQNEKGEWIESREEIEIFEGAAVARQGPHQVIFAANLNSPGAIDLLAPDGKRFRSHVLGLAYTDYASGKSVMIAEVKDCVGAVLPPNQVIYQDAFAGDCLADVRYFYTKAAFEQDVVILTAPPPPESYGLPSASTRLEVWTEFIEIPEGTMMAVALKQEADPAARQRMVEPDLLDQRLDYGVMKFEQGYAFALERGDPFGGASVATGKSIERVEGRVFLIEKVDYADVREHLQALPRQAAGGPLRGLQGNPVQVAAANLSPPSPRPSPPGEGARRSPRNEVRSNTASVAPANAAAGVATKTPVGALPLLGERDGVRADQRARALFARMLPAPKGARGTWKEKQVARVEPRRKGLVLDYITLNGSLTNQVLQGTVYVSGTVNLYGTTVLTGGAVIKGAGISIRGPLDCRTSAFGAATWTATNDNTIGEIIAGSNGSPSGYNGTMLNLYDTSAVCDLHDFRMSYGTYGIIVNGGAKADLSHFQIGKSQNGVGLIGGTATTCRNFLFYELPVRAFPVTGTVTNRSEHGTFHRVGFYRQVTNAGVFTLTNSLLISVTNNTVYAGANVIQSADDSGFFQTVGAGAHYLAGGSTNRNAGTTNINPALLAALRKKTTYPPIVLTNAITTDTALSPQAQRDTDTPDLGYQYDPLDYVFSGLTLSNATLTISPGTAIGTRTLNAYGLALLSGAKFLCEGTPASLNRVVRYNLVQEQANTNWTEYPAYSGQIFTAWTPAATAPHARVRFTEFSVPAGTALYHFRGRLEDAGAHDFRDCSFHRGILWSDRPTLGVTNCLFHRTLIALATEEANVMHPTFRHCTFAGAELQLAQTGAGVWTFENNLFDATTNSLVSGTITHNYNAYTTNATRLIPNGANDVKLSVTNVAYQTGWLGRFYLPTNLTSHSTLFNSGSAAASALGFYHYTSVTNQTRELTSTIDMGFHYVAVNSTGQPLDTDGDGLADYYEDTDGDGVADAGETNWQSYNSPNGLTGSPGLQVFTLLK
jgi:hypothetical protein